MHTPTDTHKEPTTLPRERCWFREINSNSTPIATTIEHLHTKKTATTTTTYTYIYERFPNSNNNNINATKGELLELKFVGLLFHVIVVVFLNFV